MDVRFLALSVQHTGTHFLGATLKAITGLISEGWPATAAGNRREWDVGFTMRHLYAPHPDGAIRWPDAAQDQWLEKWWDTGLPIVVPIRAEIKSFGTLARRPQKWYNAHDHRASLDRLYGLLELDRVHGFRIEPDDRHAELQALAEFLPVPCDNLNGWAETWPVMNAHA